MGRVRSKKSPKRIIIVLLLLIIVIAIIIVVRRNNRIKYGYIDNGKVVYSNLIINKSYNAEKELAVIEIKAKREELNSIIITNEILEKMKNEKDDFTKKINEIISDETLSSREKYNIQKAIELGLIKEEDNYEQYYITVTGFKNKKKFIKFCNKCFQLLEKEYKGVQ